MKKVVKKLGKVSSKKVVRPKKTVAVPAVTIAEVFTTRPESEATVNVPAHSVALFVNGRDKGIIDTTRQNLGAFAVAQAQRAGITSFSVYVDGVKADTGDKDKSLAGVKKIEIVSKDSRG